MAGNDRPLRWTARSAFLLACSGLCGLTACACDRRFEFDRPVVDDNGETPPLVVTTVPGLPIAPVGPSVGEPTSNPVDAAPSEGTARSEATTYPLGAGTSPGAGNVSATADVVDAAVSTMGSAEASAPLARGCRQDADCGHPALHCDLLTAECFECIVDADCTSPSRPWCDRALHRCVECAVNQNCGEGLVCDPVVRRCQQHCVERSGCPAGAHDCDLRREVCVNCDSDRECTTEARPFCGIGGTECVECTSDQHCSTVTYCDLLSGTCVACRDSRDCEPGQVCEPHTRSCVD